MNIQLCRTELHRLLKPTLICAGPAQKRLDYVSVSASQGELQALATDRFKLGCCRFFPVSGPVPDLDPMHLAAASLKTLLATFPLTPRNGSLPLRRNGSLPLTVSIEGTVLSVTDGDQTWTGTARPDEGDGFTTASMRISRNALSDESSCSMAGFTPAHIAAIGTIGKALGEDLAIIRFGSDATKAVTVTIGEFFLLVLMPRKFDASSVTSVPAGRLVSA